MKRNVSLFVSLGLAAVALAAIQSSRHQLAQAAAVCWGAHEPLWDERMHRCTFLLYLAWMMAIGSAEFLAVSRRNHEPDSPWPVIVLLGMFLYLGLVR